MTERRAPRRSALARPGRRDRPRRGDGRFRAARLPPDDRPLVAVNMVTSIDGRAQLEGTAEGLGSRADRRLMRLYRAAFDAVAVAPARCAQAGLWLRVGDELAARRAAAGRPPNPTGVVIAGSEPVPTDARWFTGDEPRILIVGRDNPIDGAPTGPSSCALRTSGPTRRWVLEPARRAWASASLLLEGGPHLNAAFLEARPDRRGVLDHRRAPARHRRAADDRAHRRRLALRDEPRRARLVERPAPRRRAVRALPVRASERVASRRDSPELGRIGVWGHLDTLCRRRRRAPTRAASRRSATAACGCPRPSAASPSRCSACSPARRAALVLGTSIVSIWGHDAQATRMAAETLAEATDGRFVLGLGVSHPHLAVEAARPRVRPAPDPHARLPRGLPCRDLSGPGSRWPEPPVLVAALRERMTDLAATDADGAFPYLVTPERVAWMRAAPRRGRRRAGRPCWRSPCRWSSARTPMRPGPT